MASGYDDDRDNRDDRREDDPPSSDRVIQKALAKVSTPAILLIATGAMGLVMTLLNFIQMPGMEATFNEKIEAVEKDPNLPADQKKMQKDIFTQARDIIVPIALPLYAMNAIVSLIVLFAGVKMRSLSGRGLAVGGSLLAMIPIVNGCCCLLGLPVGIWAMIVLSKPEVKAGFAAVARGPSDGY